MTVGSLSQARLNGGELYIRGTGRGSRDGISGEGLAGAGC